MYTGNNFTGYLNLVRMEHAAKYLEQTNMSVMEIALSCSFNSHTYFCRLFKRMYHLSPKEYKRAGSAKRPDGKYFTYKGINSRSRNCGVSPWLENTPIVQLRGSSFPP